MGSDLLEADPNYDLALGCTSGVSLTVRSAVAL